MKYMKGIFFNGKKEESGDETTKRRNGDSTSDSTSIDLCDLSRPRLVAMTAMATSVDLD